MLYKKMILLSATCATALLISACGGGESKKSGGQQQITSNSYVGAGSLWNITLDSNNSFNIQYSIDSSGSPIDLDINGTYVTHASSKFKTLTINQASSPSGAITTPPVSNDTGYGLEIPGYAFILKPSGSNEIISMVSAGVCPTASVYYNYVSVKSSEQVSDPTNGFFGKVAYDTTVNQLQLLDKYALTSGNPAVNITNSDFNTTCSNGVVNFTAGGSNISMYLTQAGGGIIHSESSNGDDEIYFGLPIEANASIADLSGVYSGIVYDNDNNDANPVKLTCDILGNCTGSEINITDDTNSSSVGIINLTAANDPLPGFFKGTVGSDSLICGVDLDAGGSGKNVINCISNDNTSFKNVILVER